MPRWLRAWGMLVVIVLAAVLLVRGVFWMLDEGPAGRKVLVIGSKAFSESVILSEILAQLAETRLGLRVERRYYLGSTQICFAAIRSGAIDVYPEYTGTALTSILGRATLAERVDALTEVREIFRSRYRLIWLEPLGFNNSYALGVPARLARERGLHTISDLRAHGELTAGFAPEFLARDDGWLGLRSRYNLHFQQEPRAIEAGLMYQAAAAKKLDVISAYSTDGRIAAMDVQLLEDDLGFFPTYEPAPVVRLETLQRCPELQPLWSSLQGRISEELMRKMNLDMDTGFKSAAVIAQEFLKTLPGPVFKQGSCLFPEASVVPVSP